MSIFQYRTFQRKGPSLLYTSFINNTVLNTRSGRANDNKIDDKVILEHVFYYTIKSFRPKAHQVYELKKKF